MTDLQPAIDRLRAFVSLNAPQYHRDVDADLDDDLEALGEAQAQLAELRQEELRADAAEAKLARIEELAKNDREDDAKERYGFIPVISKATLRKILEER